MTKYVMYSKDACPGCIQLEALLKLQGREVQVLKYNKDFDLQTLKNMFEAKGEPMPRTFPILFRDEFYIGGLAEARELRNQGLL